MLKVHRFSEPRRFIEHAGPFLMRAEAQNNLMLGIGGGPGSGPPAFPESCYLATIEEAGEVVACAMRTPPYKAVITTGNRNALELLAGDLSTKYNSLPAVLGPEPDVSAFADIWARKTVTRARPGMRQRLFEARQVQSLDAPPPGALRVAKEADLPLLAPWAAALFAEAHLDDPADPDEVARERVRRRNIFVWDDGRPVSMAAWACPTEHGVRINFVYTPPEHRRRGYASACVTVLTQRLFDEGRAFCCLYTDLANPTSNKIYQDIGYHVVCDMRDFHFDAA